MLNPTTLYQITGADLLTLAKEIAKELNPPPKQPPYMDSKQVIQILAEKGYKVNSMTTFRTIVENMGLKREKKGKGYWYHTQEVLNIPKRIK